MKQFSKLAFFVLLLVFGSDALAQAPSLAGFVFANAIGIAGSADITATGKKLTRKGLEPGMATSGLGLPVGSYQLQVTAPTCEPANIPLTIAAGSTPIIVAYLERKFDPQSKTTKNFIRILQFAAQPQENNFILKTVAVDADTNFSANAGQQTQLLPKFKPVLLQTNNLKVIDASGAEEHARVTEKGSYYCFVFRKADGKPGVSIVPERIYQW